MTSLKLHSEAVPPTGAVSGLGVLRSLGKPDIDLGALLFREAAQNSWDAADPDAKGPVRFDVQLRQLKKKEHKTLVNSVLRGRPDDGSDQWGHLDKHDQWVLTLSDRGTTGLGGPVYADEFDDQPTDFADFVWNVGQPPDKERGGGTYGYGKTVLFTASRADTIVAYSRARGHSGLESRLIGISLGRPFTTSQSDNQIRLTGRHWWGRIRKGKPGPVIGDEADKLAKDLGLDAYKTKETGSTFLIPACALDEDAATTMGRLTDAAIWHCWPKMLDLGDGPEMAFTFALGEEPIDTPDPDTHPEIRHFAHALRSIVGNEEEPAPVHSIDSKIPKQHLGQLALTRHTSTHADDNEDDDGDDELEVRPFAGPCHHVALMRSPKLIVKYLSGADSSTPGTAWSGVFVADDDADRPFADAEPPSHDDWIIRSSTSTGRKANPVRIALRRIREQTEDFNRPIGYDEEPEIGAPLGAVADSLGHLLITNVGGGAITLGDPVDGPDRGRKDKTKGRKHTPRRSRVIRSTPELTMSGGRRLIRAPFSVEHSADGTSSTVTARPTVRINEGASAETDPPEGAARPVVDHYESPDGRELSQTSVSIDHGDDQVWVAVIAPPPDVAVSVTFDISHEQSTP